jgi:hypothetical protein
VTRHGDVLARVICVDIRGDLLFQFHTNATEVAVSKLKLSVKQAVESFSFVRRRRSQCRQSAHGWRLSVVRAGRALPLDRSYDVRFEVFTAVTMKNGVFWDLRRVALVRTERASVASYT